MKPGTTPARSKFYLQQGVRAFFLASSKTLTTVFWNGSKSFFVRAVAYRHAALTLITSLHYRFSMLWSTVHQQQHERWFHTQVLIQSNIADMDLDPDSLSQVEEALFNKN